MSGSENEPAFIWVALRVIGTFVLVVIVLVLLLAWADVGPLCGNDLSGPRCD